LFSYEGAEYGAKSEKTTNPSSTSATLFVIKVAKCTTSQTVPRVQKIADCAQRQYPRHSAYAVQDAVDVPSADVQAALVSIAFPARETDRSR
jgi:hypothetical protein